MVSPLSFFFLQVVAMGERYFHKQYIEEKPHALIIKKRGGYLRDILRVWSLRSTYVNEDKHDYQVLSRTVFGVTQTKVVDFGSVDHTDCAWDGSISVRPALWLDVDD